MRSRAELNFRSGSLKRLECLGVEGVAVSPVVQTNEIALGARDGYFQFRWREKEEAFMPLSPLRYPSIFLSYSPSFSLSIDRSNLDGTESWIYVTARTRFTLPGAWGQAVESGMSIFGRWLLHLLATVEVEVVAVVVAACLGQGVL